MIKINIDCLRLFAETSYDNPGTCSCSEDLEFLAFWGLVLVRECPDGLKVWITDKGREALGLPAKGTPESRRKEEFVAFIWKGILPSDEELTAREEQKKEQDRKNAIFYNRVSFKFGPGYLSKDKHINKHKAHGNTETEVTDYARAPEQD